MSNLSTAGRLDHIVDGLRHVLRDLDTSRAECDCCERTRYSDKVEAFSAQAIEAAITRLSRAAVELRTAAILPPEED